MFRVYYKGAYCGTITVTSEQVREIEAAGFLLLREFEPEEFNVDEYLDELA